MLNKKFIPAIYSVKIKKITVQVTLIKNLNCDFSVNIILDSSKLILAQSLDHHFGYSTTDWNQLNPEADKVGS